MERNKALKVLFFYNGIFVLAANLLGPLYAVYVESFYKGILPISISWSVFLMSTTLFLFLVAKVGDKIKEKEYMLLAGFLIRAATWFAFVFVGDIFQLIFLQFLLGAGEALGSPAFDAIFAEHLDKNQHVTEYSNWKLVSNILPAIGVIIGGFIASLFGFKPLFVIMSALALVSFFGILFKPRKLL